MKEDDLTKTHNRVGGQVVLFFFCIFRFFFLHAFIPDIYKTFAIIYLVSYLSVAGARAADTHTDMHTNRIAYY